MSITVTYKITIAEAERKAEACIKKKFQGVKYISVRSIDKTNENYIVKGELTQKILFLTLKRRFTIKINGSSGDVKSIKCTKQP